MKNSIKSLFSHRVSRNSLALICIQLSNYVIPILLLPYLTRVLGIELFGVVAFGLAIVQLSFVVTDYGFSISATEDISVHRDNKTYIEETLSTILCIKLGIFFIIVCIVIIFAFSTIKYQTYKEFLVLTLLAIFGQSFQPFWFFQGIEKMKFVTIYTVVARLIYLSSVLLFVKHSQDFILVPVMNGIAQISAAALAIFLIYDLGYRFRRPSLKKIWKSIQHSTHYFLSRISVALYTSGSAFFLGMFGTLDQVAIYSLAEQIYKGLQGFYMPINASLYPYMAKEKDFKLFFRVVGGLFLAAIMGATIGFNISSHVIVFLFGTEYLKSNAIVTMFLFIIPINILVVFFGYGFLSAFSKTNIANNSVMIGSIFHISALLVIGLIMKLSAQLIVTIIIITELIVLTIRAYYSYKLFKNRLKNEKDSI